MGGCDDAARSGMTSLRQSAKARLAAVLCSRFSGRLLGALYHDRIARQGVVIHTSAEVVSPVVKASVFWGIYESAEIRFVRHYLDSTLDVVELGSSIGVVSSHIARRLDAGGRMVCIEANPLLLPVLRQNLAANAGHISVDVVHGAVVYGVDSPSVSFELAELSTHSQLADAAEAVRGGRRVTVPSITLADILDDRAITRYALVCDIEGAEAGLLERDTSALAECRQLIIELHDTTYDGRPVTVGSMLRRIEELGFERRDGYGSVFVFGRPRGT